MRSYKFLVAGFILGLVAMVVGVRLSRSSASHNPTPIDLSRFVNASLHESINSAPDMRFNDLSTLPRGRQFFAGTPFDVSGIVQLSGKKLQSWGRDKYPKGVFDIAVNNRCHRLHILHGASGVEDPEHTTIAEMMLHYEDGSVSILKINVGEHVRDWWGSAVEKAPEKDTEVAWLGNNLAIEERWGGAKLRLYKTTFKNPKPKLAVTTIDYTSRMQTASSFMLGLTLE